MRTTINLLATLLTVSLGTIIAPTTVRAAVVVTPRRTVWVTRSVAPRCYTQPVTVYNYNTQRYVTVNRTVCR
jgi:hypothetical protein